MCGTAITVERITADGVWQGGAIAPGLGQTARALNLMTAQLPFIELSQTPPAWGRGTVDSLKAGIFWGIVGAVRELLARQEADLGRDPWVVWTGGDARSWPRRSSAMRRGSSRTSSFPPWPRSFSGRRDGVPPD